MPQISVPLTRTPSLRPRPPAAVSISYRVLGDGPVLVLMVPGMCVPSSMYDSMAAVLAATSQFTAVVLDNRGIGRSDAPPAALLGGPGYTAHDLAADAWQVVDAVFRANPSPYRPAAERPHPRTPLASPTHTEPHAMHASPHTPPSRFDAYEDDVPPKWRAPLHPEVALVGHSMGGMIVQQMLAQRPRRVRFAALLSTHAGGVWNMVPTSRMMRGILRVAWSGFDRDVNAAVNLSLHFTQRFLDAWVVHDIDEHARAHLEDQRDDNGTHVLAEERKDGGVRCEEEPAVEDGMCAELATAAGPSNAGSGDGAPPLDANSPAEQNGPADVLPRAASAGSTGHGLGYLESKVVELVRDAQIYFGLTRSFRDKLWKPQKMLLQAIAKSRRRFRRRRREIYHAKYTGVEASHPAHLNPKNVSDDSASSVMPNPEDSPHVMYGHAAVVRSHTLSSSLAAKLKQCTRVVKLVMTGRHDKVVTPSSSRALATAIGANTVVEVEAAHFITDEAAAEVTTHVMYGLRKAFFAQNALPCECEWCIDEKQDTKTQFPSCWMC